MLPRCFAGKSSFTCSLGFASQVWIFTVIVYYVVFICFYFFFNLLACLFAGWMNGCMIDQLTINYWIYWLVGQLIGWLMGWWVLIWLVGWLIGSLIGWNDGLVGSQWWIVFSFVDCCVCFFCVFVYNVLWVLWVLPKDSPINLPPGATWERLRKLPNLALKHAWLECKSWSRLYWLLKLLLFNCHCFIVKLKGCFFWCEGSKMECQTLPAPWRHQHCGEDHGVSAQWFQWQRWSLCCDGGFAGLWRMAVNLCSSSRSCRWDDF